MQQAVEGGYVPTAEQLAALEEQAADTSNIMTLAGDTARIGVEGVLTEKPNWLAAFFGGGNTTYESIRSALAEAEADPNVKQVELLINSGGGQVAGMFETLAAEQTFSKPLVAKVKHVGASAAYAIASQADTIEAANPATRVGSIGVAVEFSVSPFSVSIASTNAPKKRPDVRTEEGRADVRAELDDLHGIFVDAIAAGRKTTIDRINAEFGEGGVLLAGEALKRGMIDRIGGTIPATKPSASAKKQMTLADLKAQHSDVFQAAKDEGANSERDRVIAHLTLGKQSGAIDVAIEAIEKGEELTASRQAQYMAAAMTTQETNARQAETDDANAIVDGAKPDAAKPASQDEGDQTWAAFNANRQAEEVI